MTIVSQTITNKRTQKTLDQKSVLKQISSFIRKMPTYEGAHTLQQYSQQLDLSYTQTLITSAKKYFGQAFRQWSKYQLSLEIPITNFINNIYSKIHHSKLICLENIFAPLVASYTKTTKKKPILQNHQQTKLQQTDLVMKDYINKKEKKLQNQKQIQVKKQKPIRRGANDLIGQLVNNQQIQKKELVLKQQMLFGQNSDKSRIQHWKQLYFKVNLMYSNFFLLFSPILRQKIEQSLKKKIISQNQLYKTSLQNTPEWKLLELSQPPYTNYRDCACCLSYIQENEDLSFPPFPQPVSYFGQIKWHGDMQNDLTEQMVSYLNGRGGVIFVGCSRNQNNQIIPNIAVTQQSTKDQIQSKLRTYVESISPVVQLKRQIDLTFIPVAVSRNQKLEMKPNWIAGTYILKIVVIPTEPQNTYYYTFNKLIHYSKNIHYSNVELKEEQIYEFMKNRYFQFNVKICGGLREKGNIVPAVFKHNGSCRIAEKGSPEYGQGHFNQDYQDHYRDGNGTGNPLLAERAGYKSVSLLVADREALGDIKQIFREVQKIEVVIEVAFPHLQFRLSNNTWLVWHNVKFQKLMTGLKKETNSLKLKNGRRPVLLISTCNTLKSLAQEYFSNDVIDKIINFAMKHANEKIQHKYVQKYDYFKCPSVITAVLIYFYITHYQKTKCVFQKIPVGSNGHKHTRPSEAKVPPVSGKKNHQYRERYQEQNQYYDDRQVKNHSNHYKQKAIDYTVDSINNDSNYQYQRQKKKNKKKAKKSERQYYEDEAVQMEENVNNNYQIQKQPKCITFSYDSYYNQFYYYDNGIVYCYTPDKVFLGSRIYEQSQLDYIIALQNTEVPHK